MDFKNQKKQVLQGIDLSRKGSVDSEIVDLVQFINCLDEYVTTSSCSGRAILYCTSFDDEGKKSKRDCQWLYTSHDKLEVKDVISKADPAVGDLQFKYEPFILHVQCASLEAAQYLHKIAVGAGFRESGISVGKHGKVVLAIRSNVRLEVPLSDNGVMFVSDHYLAFLVQEANEKIKLNSMKIKHFFVVLKEMMEKKTQRSEAT